MLKVVKPEMQASTHQQEKKRREREEGCLIRRWDPHYSNAQRFQIGPDFHDKRAITQLKVIFFGKNNANIL